MSGEGSKPGLLTSGVLGHVPHGFTTRVGGVSGGMFASLNFGNPGDLVAGERDGAGNIEANFGRVLDAMGCAGREVVEVHQVHGAEVHVVRRGERAHAGRHDTKADALVTDDPGRVLAIRVADCAPVLLASGDGKIVGAAHAGWRGVIGGVVAETVEVMKGLGAREISAAVGPCISGESFEVGEEVVAEFVRVFGNDREIVLMRTGKSAPLGKAHVDLKAALVRQLREAEVGRVEVAAGCTVRDRDLFFSHRREKGRTGRMVGVIGCH